MPIFEFQCEKCENIDEKLTFNRELEKIECSKCNSISKKIISLSKFDLVGIWGNRGYDEGNYNTIEDGPEESIKAIQKIHKSYK